jgi:hypothetical protein
LIFGRAALAAAIAAGASGCGGATPAVQTANVDRGPSEGSALFPETAAGWSGVHSGRFAMTIPLPHAGGWVVDDHSRAELVAIDRATKSTLVVLREIEPDLVNHTMCEGRARTLGLVPSEPTRTIEDVVTTGPEAFDTRVRVAIEARGGANGPLVGHVMAFGAYVRKCLFVHLTTSVASEADEATLSQRLAMARVKLVAGITIDELDTVPRATPVPSTP